MDVFTVCNVLQAIGVLEDATMNPPPTTVPTPPPLPKDLMGPGFAPSDPIIDPTSPQPSSLTSPKPIQQEPAKPSPTTISTPHYPLTSPLPDLLEKPPATGPPDLSQLLRSSTPILPISFDHIGESSTANPVIPSIAELDQVGRGVEEVKELKTVTESEAQTPLVTKLSIATGSTQLGPSSASSSFLPTTQSRSTYGAQVESSLTVRWERHLREYLKDLRCRKISHIMGREAYHGVSSGSGGGINSRGVSAMNRAPIPTVASSRPLLPSPLHPPTPPAVTQTSSLDDEEFDEDDETTNHSQSTTPPPTPIGIAVPSTGLSIVAPPPVTQIRPTTTTPREAITPSLFPLSKERPPVSSLIQTGILSPISLSTSQTKEKKPVMRRFTGSTRGGWAFPTPLVAPNEFGLSQYDIFLNPQEVLTKWSQICYEESKAEEMEECLLRQIASRCDLPLPLEPFRIGTHYLSSDYRVTLTKTRSGSISQVPGDHTTTTVSRPRSSSRSSSTGTSSGGGQKNSKQNHSQVSESTSSVSAVASSNTSSSATPQQQQQSVDTSSASLSPFQHVIENNKKSGVSVGGGVYDDTSTWTATSLLEKAKRNNLHTSRGGPGRIFQKKPKFDDTTSTGPNYFFPEGQASPRHHSTPLSHHTPLDLPSSRKRSRSGSSLSGQYALTPSSSSSSNRPYCPVMLLYESLYRSCDSSNTDQSAGPDVCPVTGRLSLVDVIINTRPIPWTDIARQFMTLQIDEHHQHHHSDHTTAAHQMIDDTSMSSNKTPLVSTSTGVGQNLNGSIGTWVEIRLNSDDERERSSDQKTTTMSTTVGTNTNDETRAKERRGRKKYHHLSDENYSHEERRPKRAQRQSSNSSLNDEEKKNYRQEFRRVSFADVLAPSFREVSHYNAIYSPPPLVHGEGGEVVDEKEGLEEEEEDLSDEAIAARHEETLKRMRDKWTQIQELKDSLKKSATPSTPSSAKHHHFASPRQGGQKALKSPGTPHGRGFSFGHTGGRKQRNSLPMADLDETTPTPPKRSRGRRNQSDMTVELNKSRRGRTLTPPVTFAEQSSSSSKKRTLKELSSSSAGDVRSAGGSDDRPLQPRKRGRPPKYHPPVAPPVPLPDPLPTLPAVMTPTPSSVKKSVPKKGLVGASTRLSSSSSSLVSEISSTPIHHPVNSFPSSEGEDEEREGEGVDQLLQQHLLSSDQSVEEEEEEEENSSSHSSSRLHTNGSLMHLLSDDPLEDDHVGDNGAAGRQTRSRHRHLDDEEDGEVEEEQEDGVVDSEEGEEEDGEDGDGDDYNDSEEEYQSSEVTGGGR
jgi:hypothetical protein